MRNIIITEDQVEFIKQNKAYIENNNAEVFNKEVRKFLYCLMTDSKENISDYWKINGITKIEIFKILKKFKVVIEIEGGNLLIPKKNFDKKVERVYYQIFGDNEPGMVMVEDDGGGGGGTSCSSVGGSYEVPLFGVQRRTIKK